MVDFKDMKGGDPEGQAKNNIKKPEEKTESTSIENMLQDKLDEFFARRKDINRDIDKEYDFPITPLEDILILLFQISNYLEDSIEDFITKNREKGIEEELLPIFKLATALRESIHTIIEKELRHYFSTEELIRLANKLDKDAT